MNKTKSCYFILFPFLCAGEELSTTELSRFSRYSFGQENRELADFTYIIINTLCYASLHFKRKWNLPLNWAVTHKKILKITACPPLPLFFGRTRGLLLFALLWSIPPERARGFSPFALPWPLHLVRAQGHHRLPLSAGRARRWSLLWKEPGGQCHSPFPKPFL